MLYRAPSDLMIAAAPSFVSKGAVNVISLDHLKASAGDQWPRIRDGVYARLETLLRAMLGPADFFAQINDTAFLVTMPASQPEEVNLICLRAAYELHNSFLGNCRLDQLAVGTAQPGGSQGEISVRPLAVPQLNALANKAGIHPLPPKTAARGAGDGQAAESAAGKANTDPAQLASQRVLVKHQFLPIWSAPTAAITTYLCEPSAIVISPRRDIVPFSALDANERLEVEMSCFHHGLNALTKAVKDRKQFILAIGLTFEMLGSPAGREAVLSTLRNQPHELRGYLAFVIHQVPQGVAQTKLGTIVNLLRPFGRSVGASLAPHCRLYHAYQNIGLNSIGMILNEFGTTPPTQYEIEELSLFARRNHMGTFISHINNVNILKFVQDAGIQQISGQAITPPCEEPRGVWRLTWQKLMAEPIVEIWS